MANVGTTGLVGSDNLPDSSLDFEANNTEYLSMSDANFGSYDLDLGTFSAWIRLESLGGDRTLLCQMTTETSNFAFRMGVNAGGQIQFDVSTNGGISSSNGRLISTATLSTSTWYHLKYLYDMQNNSQGNRMRIWLDGSEVTAFDTDTRPPKTSMYNSTSSVYIGEDPDSGGSYDGLIYQPAFFSNVDVPIGDLYNSGSPKDVTGISGLYSLLNTKDADTLEDDYVLSTNWTNTNTVTKSSTIPT
jgi:hypothetical protein